MDNPTLLNSINNKLVLAPGVDNFGSGIKIATVAAEPQQDTLTTHATLDTTGAKYITENIGAQIAVGSFTINTTAIKYNVFCNSGGIIKDIKLTGVDGSLNEVSETVTTNGTTIVLTANNYLHINDIEQVSGSFLTSTETVFCQPSTGQDKRIILNGLYKVNWGIMVGRKNGVSRRARLTQLNQIQNTGGTPVTYNIVVFPGTNAVDTGTGLFNVVVRLSNTLAPVQGPTNYGICGLVDLKLGELCVWYRTSTTVAPSNVVATWTYYNA